MITGGTPISGNPLIWQVPPIEVPEMPIDAIEEFSILEFNGSLGDMDITCHMWYNYTQVTFTLVVKH